MELFDLPVELFQCVVRYLVRDVGPLYVADYRLVCRLFAIEIQNEILAKQPLVAYSQEERRLPAREPIHVATARDDARFTKLFAQHGGTIIGHEVLRDQKNPLPLVKHLKVLTETVLRLKDSESRKLRRTYTFDISNAISGVYQKQLRWRISLRTSSEIADPSIEDDLPAALAATGNVKLLLELASTRANCLTKSGSSLPDPLSAAAASGQVETVKMLADHILQETKANPSTAIRTTTMDLGDALKFAIRKGQMQTGVLISDRLYKARGREMLSHRLTMECLQYLDTGLLRRVLIDNQRVLLKLPQPRDYGTFNQKLTLRVYEMDQLFTKGSRSMLRAFLRDGLIDANHFDSLSDLDQACYDATTPLALAVHHHRYDLARVLIQHGAHIDGVPRTGNPVTALWHAARDGYIGCSDAPHPGVRFLLKHGADPDIHGDWRSPLRAAEKRWPDVYFILQQAKDFGVDVALHPDTWRRYELVVKIPMQVDLTDSIPSLSELIDD